MLDRGGGEGFPSVAENPIESAKVVGSLDDVVSRNGSLYCLGFIQGSCLVFARSRALNPVGVVSHFDLGEVVDAPLYPRVTLSKQRLVERDRVNCTLIHGGAFLFAATLCCGAPLTFEDGTDRGSTQSEKI